MKYLVKVDAGGGKVETYTTEAPDAAGAMLQAYDKYGVCGVTVSPYEQEAVHMITGKRGGWVDVTPEQYAQAADWNRRILYRSPACPVDTAIANLDALLAERRASTMDHAQLAALGRDGSRISSKHEAVIRLAAKAIHNRGHEGDARLADSLLGVLAHLKSGEQERTA